MNVWREVNDRIDVVSDLFGFGRPAEPHIELRVTRALRPDRDLEEMAWQWTGHALLLAIVVFGAIVIVSQIRIAMAHQTPPPIGTYYVDRDTVSGDR